MTNYCALLEQDSKGGIDTAFIRQAGYRSAAY